MKKLQQYYVYKLDSNKILKNGLELNVPLLDAKRNNELIALGDNQVLRTIRRLTDKETDEGKLEWLMKEKTRIRKLLKKEPTAENKSQLFEVLRQIDDMLYIPEYVSVVNESRSQYNKIAKKGFILNGERYVRLLCSAGNARHNTSFFVKEKLFKDLYKILSCGHKNVKIAEAKYNAYFALSGSATFVVSTPKVVVVPDLEVTRKEKVDWVDYDGKEYKISEQEKDLPFNLWDGMGLISPLQAKKWAEELELDYLPSGFLIRAPFIKGMVFTFDIHKFAYDKAGTRMIKDVWGNEHHVDDIEVILTQSQFKLWYGYDSWNHYEECLKASGLKWGVAKVPPKEDKDFIRTNYQFIQVLNLNEEQIKGLCKPTVDWFDGVLSGDINYIKLYMLGKMADKDDGLEIWNSINDPTLKALLLCDKVKGDKHIQDKIMQSIRKRIKESYYGKLLVRGNFQTMIADPYALCEYIFGMEVKGLLARGQCYSEYWNNRGVDTIAGLRAPLTWRSEVNKIELKDDEETREWYKYTNSGIVYNVHGVDDLIHAGSDKDKLEKCPLI